MRHARALSAALLAATCAVVPPAAVGQQNTPVVPTIDQLVSLATVSGAVISPDGTHVAYLQSEADFEVDEFITQLWVAHTGTGSRVQLTRGAGSVRNVQWSPDSR